MTPRVFLTLPRKRGRAGWGLFLSAVLLAACGSAGGWEKPGTAPDILARDARDCRVRSDKVLVRDRSIDQDIEATRGPDWQRAGTADPQGEEMRAHAAADAAALFAACMRAKGYTKRG